MDETVSRQPAIYITHGGGPCFFMEWDPPDAWDELRTALESIAPSLPEPPRAILVVSAHWEERQVAVASGASPSLIYDYGGFPPHTYQLTYPAPGAPDVAGRAAELLAAAGVEHRLDPDRGWDHGVFVPLKVMFPDADVPVVAASLRADLDPAAHVEIGRAIAPLRDEGVLVVGSGSSFHNFAHFGSPLAEPFDDWLHETASAPPAERERRIVDWQSAPYARVAHQREEHLLPLMVVIGAAEDDAARPLFRGTVLDTKMSCWSFE